MSLRGGQGYLAASADLNTVEDSASTYLLAALRVSFREEEILEKPGVGTDLQA